MGPSRGRAGAMSALANARSNGQSGRMMLGPPNRGNDPLHVLAMAAALVLAAVLGAALGFVLDLAAGDSPVEAQRTAAP